MLSAYIVILLGCVYLALSSDYDDFIHNYRAIARGTDAPEGSNNFTGRIQYNITVKIPPSGSLTIPFEGTGYFAMHKGANGEEKFFFVTVAHLFDLSPTPPEFYIKPGRNSQISLISKGTIEIFYGSVKLEDQKVFQVYPNGLYTTPILGLAHIVRVSSAYPFNDTMSDPNIDIVTIELTENQAHQFANDGGIFAVSKDDSPEKLFPVGEVCTTAGWGFTDVDITIKATRLQQANIMARDKQYCLDSVNATDPLRNVSNFACFSTHFSSDNDPIIRLMDSGSLVSCGSGDGLVATMVIASERFAVVGPTRQSILKFIKDSFYD